MRNGTCLVFAEALAKAPREANHFASYMPLQSGRARTCMICCCGECLHVDEAAVVTTVTTIRLSTKSLTCGRRRCRCCSTAATASVRGSCRSRMPSRGSSTALPARTPSAASASLSPSSALAQTAPGSCSTRRCYYSRLCFLRHRTSPTPELVVAGRAAGMQGQQ